MEKLLVSEHWTDSRAAVVLSGKRATLEEVVRLLDLPASQLVVTRNTSAALGLWEALHLEAYEELKRSGRIVVHR